MSRTKTNKLIPPRPPQFYHGATDCDFRPAWGDSHPELLSLLNATFDADPNELTPQLVLADWLAERGDPREQWVRVGVDLWSRAAALKPGRLSWNHEASKSVLAPVCATTTGWRVSALWGCLVAWHGPSGYDGVPLGRTWVDARVAVVQRCLWFWAIGFLSENPLDMNAMSQAYAAGRQADAAGRQADAARRQAYAAGRQELLWCYARACWEKLCVPAIAKLGG